MDKKKYGVIVGRFQNHTLTDGHLYLLRQVEQECSKVIVFVGKSSTINTDRDPIPAEFIADFIKREFFTYDVQIIEDHPNDLRWIENLDEKISKIVGENEICLYGSRDSFLKIYEIAGKYPCQYISPVNTSSSTEERKRIKDLIINNKDFRKGLIYASQIRFATVYSTVDILVYDKFEEVLLLGRKKGSIKWCVPGGFVDVSDEDLVSAAKRELSEEVPNLLYGTLRYLTSLKIEDFRYSRTKDSVMTHLFITYTTIQEHCKAGDDLDEVKWVPLKECEELLGNNHKKFLKYI